MGEKDVVPCFGEWQILQEFLVLIMQNPVGPDRREAGVHGKLIGDRQIDGCRVMVTEENDGAPLADHSEAFIGIGAVADNIPEADNLIYRASVDEVKRRGEGFEITVDVGDDCEAHGWLENME